MKHELSAEDRRFQADVEGCRIAAASFDHRSHLRLAYTFLAEHGDDAASALMRDTLLRFLAHHAIDPSKYHETITRAWILAVRHFMAKTPASPSSDAFIERNPILLDSKIMLTHYSAELLFSPDARASFVEPDLDPIPRHEPP